MNQHKDIKIFLKKIIKDLNDLKAIDIKFIDIKNRSALGDFLLIVTGNSTRHINAIASKVIENYKKRVISVEGLKDIVDHVMTGLDRERKAGRTTGLD